MKTMTMLWIIFLFAFDVSNGLYINRAFQHINSWTNLAEFCFLQKGGSVQYNVESGSPIPLVLYYSPGQETVVRDNGLDSIQVASSPNTTVGVTEQPLQGVTNMDQIGTGINTTVTSRVKDVTTESSADTNEASQPSKQAPKRPCSPTNIQIFRSVDVLGKGNFNVVSETKDVMCLKFAIAPACRESFYDFKLKMTIINTVDTFWWRQVSADDLFLFISDMTAFGLIAMLCLAAVCIRVHLTSQKFYVHALNSCILSMLLFALALGVNILLHGLFSVEGYDVGNVRVIIRVIFISAQALFLQAVFLSAMKHTWCNEETKLERGYKVSLCVSALVIFYGLSLVAIHVFEVFSQAATIALYAQFSLHGLMWIIFVFMVLCTATSVPPVKEDPAPKYLTNSLAKSGRLGPPQPPLRSLFGDYDYAINLPAVMEHQALQNLQNANSNDDVEDDRATNYTDFDHVVTPTPPGEETVRWVGIEVSGHYSEGGTVQPLGGCAVLVYSWWFLAVPLLSLWSPYLLPPWLTMQCVYALGLLNCLVGYIYFLASSVACKEKITTVPQPQEIQTVQHISVL